MNPITSHRYFRYAIAPIALASLLVWVYVAGAIFLWHLHTTEEPTLITLYQYAYYYWDNVPLRNVWINSIALGFVAVAFPLLLLLAPRRRSPFGNAKLAGMRDIKKAGLLSGKGILLGKYRGAFLWFDRGTHAMMSAPTGAGKGVSFAVPNLLTFPESVVAFDIKKELWELTSGYRHKYGQKCFLFAPGATDYKTHRCNPLSYVSDDPNFRVDDINKIAYMFYPDREKGDPIWTSGPRGLFTGLALYLIETGQPLTLGGILRASMTGGDPKDFFEEEIGRLDEEGTPLSAPCVMSLLTYTSVKADNTRSGILGGFRAGLEIFMNPLIDAATCGNDFDLRDLRKKPMTVYVHIPAGDIARFSTLLELFFQMLADLNTRQKPSTNPDLKYQCLLLMDEFAQLKLPLFAKGISIWREYKLQLISILQSPAQLVDMFGPNGADNFRTNCDVNLVFPPKASDTKAAGEISDWMGMTTVKNRSRSGSASILQHRPATVNDSDMKRPLMLPQEISGLKERAEILIVDKCQPILADKLIYHQEKVFVNRLKEISPTLRKVWGYPNKKQYDRAMMLGELSAPVPTITITGVNLKMTIPKNSYHFDWDDIKAPPTGYMDKTALMEYADALCRGAGVEF